MDTDAFCLAMSRHAGLDPCISSPDLDEQARSWIGDEAVVSGIRTVQLGPVEAVVLSYPASFASRGGRAKSAPDVARDISGQVGILCRSYLPKRQWGRTAIALLEGAWPDPDLVSSCIELDERAVPKFAWHSGQPLSDLFDRMPAVARLWDMAAPPVPVWLTRLEAAGGLGPLGEVSLELPPGPGLLVLSGSNGTGKSLLLSSVRQSLIGQPSPLETTFSGTHPGSAAARQIMLGGPVPDAGQRDLAPYRRLMGYADHDGGLTMPIAFEGNYAQGLERTGCQLYDSALSRTPGSWPGTMLDSPLAGLDAIRTVRLAETIVRLARERQITVTSRDTGQDALWKAVAADWGVPCDVVDLRGGRAVLAQPLPHPSAAPDPGS